MPTNILLPCLPRHPVFGPGDETSESADGYPAPSDGVDANFELGLVDKRQSSPRFGDLPATTPPRMDIPGEAQDLGMAEPMPEEVAFSPPSGAVTSSVSCRHRRKSPFSRRVAQNVSVNVSVNERVGASWNLCSVTGALVLVIILLVAVLAMMLCVHGYLPLPLHSAGAADLSEGNPRQNATVEETPEAEETQSPGDHEQRATAWWWETSTDIVHFLHMLSSMTSVVQKAI